jgi:DNA repair protein RadC
LSIQGRAGFILFFIFRAVRRFVHVLLVQLHGLPNFGSSFFYQTELSSFSTNNTYHALSEIDRPGKPHACSSPIAHQAKKGSSEIKGKNRIQRPSKIVDINLQSIRNKKPELDILLDTTKQDVIIGTETWFVGSNQVSVPIITSGFVVSNNMSSSGFLFLID